jgi:threonine dehydrogenase-like Zn-dependent dehydrogenase
MKRKTAVLTEFKAPLEIREEEIVPLQKGEVLVELAASGVCGSDVHMWKGKDPRTPLPLVLGHEGVGTVVDVSGPKTDIFGNSVEEGDLIIWDRGVTCDQCYFCAVRKEPSLCPKRQVYGIVRDGCYATHLTLLAGTKVIRLVGEIAVRKGAGGKSAIDPAILVAASCSGATAAHTVELLPIQAGDLVVLQGPGPLGLFCLAFAFAKGASEAVVIGTRADAKRLELAKEFGAVHTSVVEDSSVEARREEVMELTNGIGANVVIDCTGTPASFNEGLRLTAPGGTYSLPGIATPVGEVPMRLYEDVARKNVRIQGVWVSDTSHLYQAVRLVLSGRFPLHKLVTHRFPLEKVMDALKVVDNKEAIKAVLVPGEK